MGLHSRDGVRGAYPLSFHRFATTGGFYSLLPHDDDPEHYGAPTPCHGPPPGPQRTDGRGTTEWRSQRSVRSHLQSSEDLRVPAVPCCGGGGEHLELVVVRSAELDRFHQPLPSMAIGRGDSGCHVERAGWCYIRYTATLPLRGRSPRGFDGPHWFGVLAATQVPRLGPQPYEEQPPDHASS